MTQYITRRRLLAAAAVAASVALGACGSIGSAVNPAAGGTQALLGSLADLGVSPTQALGGTGALMNAAKSSLGADKFAAVSKALPGMDSMLGDATKALGGSLPTTTAGVAESFQKLGMKPEQVGQFSNAITNHLGKNGGGGAADLLKAAWGG